jgi:hypothetical protein
MRDNGNPHLCEAAIDLHTRASTHDLRRLRRLGGGKVTLIIYGCRRIACEAKPTAAVATPLKKDERQARCN